jgi:hypothetical protein
MTAPYTPALITRLLRNMPAEQLRDVTPRNFQLWPVAKNTLPGGAIADLIANERSRRMA